MKLALVCCTLLTGCAVLLAIIWDSSDGEVTNSGPRRTLPNGPPYPGGTTDNIFWFIQITDIHISRYTDPDRAPDLSAFLKDRVPAINPELILVSGDLTDAKTVDRQGSRQYEDEWQLYWKTIQTSGVLKSTVWLDIRGNHDAFDVASLDSRTNFFRKYSVQGGKHDQSYAYELKKSFGTYNFIGLDACPNPGPKRPFNFFGYLSEERVSELERLDLASRYGNMTIWFGHYPSSTIVNMTGIRRMLGGGIAYLCGHLHTLGNLVPNMYANQYAGYLELELGDWKDNRMYRLLAVDHDMLSFTDESFDHWPVILVTNPKHAQFQVPNHEPLRRVHNSTHIRVLVFSPWAVDTVTIEVDDVMLPGVQHAGKGLYVVPWSPKLYTRGLHTINVYAKDSKGNIREVSQPFSLDGSRPEFRFLPSLILMSHISTIGMLLFMLSCLSVILPLFILRRHQHPPQVPVSLSHGMCEWPVSCVYTRLRWIWMAANCDIVYYTFNSFTIYVAIGPWFVGYLLNEHLGLVFSWGIYIHSAFMPGSITYFYGFFQILTFNIPLLLYFGYALDYNQRVKKSIRSVRYLCWRRDWYLVLLLCFQSYMAYGGFYLAYGGVALLICPVRTWSVILAIALFSKTVRSIEVKGFQCEENSR